MLKEKASYLNKYCLTTYKHYCVATGNETLEYNIDKEDEYFNFSWQ